METVGFLMLSHRISPDQLAVQARMMVDAGAQCVYVVGSAGALVLADGQVRVRALLDEIGAEAQVGFRIGRSRERSEGAGDGSRRPLKRRIPVQ